MSVISAGAQRAWGPGGNLGSAARGSTVGTRVISWGAKLQPRPQFRKDPLEGGWSFVASREDTGLASISGPPQHLLANTSLPAFQRW